MISALALLLLQPEPFATITAKDAAKELGLELRFSSEARLGVARHSMDQSELEWVLSLAPDPAHPARLIRTEEIKKSLAEAEDARALRALEEFRKRADKFRPINDEVELVRNLLNVRSDDVSRELNAPSAYIHDLTVAIIRDNMPPLSWNKPMPPIIHAGRVTVPEKYQPALAAIRRAVADPGLWEEERNLANRPPYYVRNALVFLTPVTEGEMRLVINPWAFTASAKIEVHRSGFVTGSMSADYYHGFSDARESKIELSDSAPKTIRWIGCDYRLASRTPDERKAMGSEMVEWPDWLSEHLAVATDREVVAWFPDDVIYELVYGLFPHGSGKEFPTQTMLDVIAKWCDVRDDGEVLTIRPRYVVRAEALSLKESSWSRIRREVSTEGELKPRTVGMILMEEPWLGFMHPAEAVIGLLPIYEAAYTFQPNCWLAWHGAVTLGDRNVPFDMIPESLRKRLLRYSRFRMVRSAYFDMDMPPSAGDSWPITSSQWRMEYEDSDCFALPPNFRASDRISGEDPQLLSRDWMGELKNGLNPEMRNVPTQVGTATRVRLVLDMGNGVTIKLEGPWSHQFTATRPLIDVLNDVPE